MTALFLLALASNSGFVRIPAGTYSVGKLGVRANPGRQVSLRAYDIARTDVTNADFEKFVKATGYITDAERKHDAMVFVPPLKDFRWIQDPTAYWRYPNGAKRGGIENKMDHPVTGISFRDATEYCKWAHVRLPTLDEWEVASRAGAKTDYFFGRTPDQIGKYANIWHGHNHLKPDYSDGYMYTSPVAHFRPNPLGLYDVYGNVFQFCSGRLPTDRSKYAGHARGGSWWCSQYSCCFFNSVDIGTVAPHASFSNQGFRVVRL